MEWQLMPICLVRLWKMSLWQSKQLFDKSSSFSPTKDPANTPILEPHHPHQVRTLPSHLRYFHCFFALASLQEPHTSCEAFSNLLWQKAIKEKLDSLPKIGTWDMLTSSWQICSRLQIGVYDQDSLEWHCWSL